MLFAQNGFEATSTATIAREAGSSESQLIRYFGGKAGLLETIFNEAWSALNDSVAQHVNEAEHGRDALIRILGMMIQAFSRDHDIAFLFLFEGRRTRGVTHEVLLSKGFQKFSEVLAAMIDRGVKDGSFRGDIHPRILGSAMLGCAEGMIRDRVLAVRNNLANPFEDEAIIRTFTAMVNGLAP